MEKTKKYYTEDLIEEAIDDLQSRLEWNKKHYIEDEDIDDLITEVADNNIPIYTYDLLQHASNNFDLIQANDLCAEGSDVVQIISANIYEVLTEALYEYITKQDKE